ncbi:LANO_0G02586g1_1 [Lachancea nothofagi CBS 11611]|uniref:LANO_0G02586g1_1 n=1 Tax=Lachancea nothofagi CBS 11611 TaxID=1266666 RepID=A0A1G4KFC0_9SACH|nr:LANO_0G02586g1_1 [Lachancea nothofagi CBS 11611]
MAQLDSEAGYELRNITEQLDGILSDPDTILASIENDPKLTFPSEVSSPESGDVQALLAREAQLSKQLLIYRELDLISELLEEVKLNFQLWELENCFYSLQNIRKKLDQVDLSKLPMQFQESLKLHIDEFHLNLVSHCDSAMRQFWKIGAGFISFNRTITVGEEQLELEYTQFKQFLKACFFSEGRFEPNIWFISSLNMSDVKETLIKQLSKIHNDYCELQVVQGKLKSFLFSSNVCLKIKDNDTLETISERCNLHEIINSFGAVVEFLSETVTTADAGIILSRLGNTIVVEIIKFFKQNSNQLLAAESQHKDELLVLNEKLKLLSEKVGDKWLYYGREFDTLLNDDSVINNLKLDKILQVQNTRIREAFKSADWQTTKVITNFLQDKVSANSAQPEMPKEVEENQNLEDEWGWGHDDATIDHHDEEENNGWDDEIELALETNAAEQTPAKSKLATQVEGSDDWQHAWDESISVSEDSNAKVTITQIPALCLQMLSDFELGCDEIGRAKIESILDYKLNLLLTSFMAMCMCKYKDWWQLYHDVEYIVAEYPNKRKVFRLQELNSHFVRAHVENLKKTMKTLMNRQFKSFLEHDKNPNWTVTIESLLPYVEGVALPAIFKLHNPRILSEFVNYIYVDCFVDTVMSWRLISERNSENLAELIKLLLTSTNHPQLESDANCKHSREKLAIVGEILTAHLTHIMDMFSNGDFYLFSTDEIVQWIVMLFADTGLRRECIDEIRTIREERSG